MSRIDVFHNRVLVSITPYTWAAMGVAICISASVFGAARLVNFYRAMLCHSMSSVRLSVIFRYRDHIGWNTSKIISRLNSLKFVLGLIPIWAIWSIGNTVKFRVE